MFCIVIFFTFNVIIFTVRCYAERGYATVYCPSVRLSVTFRFRDHIGWKWNSWKIISRPNSLRPLLGQSPTWVIWCNENTPKIGVK